MYASLCIFMHVCASVSLVQLVAHVEDFSLSLEHSDYICVDEPDAAHAAVC